jgi:hypothetical protein
MSSFNPVVNSGDSTFVWITVCSLQIPLDRSISYNSLIVRIYATSATDIASFNILRRNYIVTDVAEENVSCTMSFIESVSSGVERIISTQFRTSSALRAEMWVCRGSNLHSIRRSYLTLYTFPRQHRALLPQTFYVTQPLCFLQTCQALCKYHVTQFTFFSYTVQLPKDILLQS